MIKCSISWLVLSASFIFIRLMMSTHALPQKINRAAEIGDTKKIKELLKKNPESVNAKNKYGITPLYFAALYGNKDAAELLILS